MALSTGAAAGTGCRATEMPPTPGPSSHIAPYLQQLTDAGPDAFLVIEVAPPDMFLQVKWTAEGFELDHPLITAGQIRREARFRELCNSGGYPLREVAADAGGQFLDCYLPRDIPSASAAIRDMLQDLFAVSDSTGLIYSGVGLEPVAL